MADKITGEGIVQTLSLVNLARSLLAGPETFVIGSIRREATNDFLAGLDLPELGGALKLASNIPALSSLSPIGGALALVGTLFGRSEQQGPVIANLPPHNVLNIIHQKEAIHAFVMDQARFNSWVTARSTGIFGALPRQWQTAMQGGLHLFDPRAAMLRGPNDSEVLPVLNLASQAWAPGWDSQVFAAMAIQNAELVPDLGNPCYYTARWQIPEPKRPSTLSPFQIWIPPTLEDRVKAIFATGDPNCKRLRWQITFGIPYMVEWLRSWSEFNVVTINLWRAEIGNWVQKVSSHQYYKFLIQRMIQIENQRAAIRKENASRMVALIRAGNLQGYLAFRPRPIEPALVTLEEIRPSTAAELGIHQQILVAREQAAAAVQEVRTAIDRSKDKPEILKILEGLLSEAIGAAESAMETSNAEIATSESLKAKTAAAKATGLTTTALSKIAELLKNPKIMIPGLIALGVLLWAGSKEGR